MYDKDKIVDFIKNCGFENLTQFSKEAGVDRGNLHRYVYGELFPDILTCFKIARALKVPIDSVLNLFYGELMRSNNETVNSSFIDGEYVAPEVVKPEPVAREVKKRPKKKQDDFFINTNNSSFF